MNAGYKNDDFGDAVFYNPEKTNVEIYRDNLKLVRDAAGGPVFLLGCNVAQNMRHARSLVRFARCHADWTR